jgi:cytochrome c553
MMKKISLLFVLVGLVALMIPTIASANFAIHGNYVGDTDACAGCHRAHTSVSTITWQDISTGDQHSALLVTSATEIWQFCYACHDATSQGADTNVQQGIYEGTLYGSQNATLNGGGFDETGVGSLTTSKHEIVGGSWGAYGGGYFGTGSTFAGDYSDAGQGPNVFITGTGNAIKMDCVTCHDPHGSPNYRILKSYVNGNYVGGYVPSGNPLDPNPDGWVSSVETGWPQYGFRLHTAYPNYVPNYTTGMYAKGYDMTSTVLNATKGMSGWCAGCHNTYLRPVSVFTKADGTTYTASASIYNAGDGSGLALRHRHPINVELNTYNGPDKTSMVITTSILPLAHSLSESGTPTNRATDWIECLTCHRAHGTSAAMTGYASYAGAQSVVDTDGVARNLYPANPSALLRRDNRGVCEACHNK